MPEPALPPYVTDPTSLRFSFLICFFFSLKKRIVKATVNDIIYKALKSTEDFFKCYGYFDDYDGKTLKYFKQWYSR